MAPSPSLVKFFLLLTFQCCYSRRSIEQERCIDEEEVIMLKLRRV